MAGHYQNAPNLASILQTLANLQNPQYGSQQSSLRGRNEDQAASFHNSEAHTGYEHYPSNLDGTLIHDIAQVEQRVSPTPSQQPSQSQLQRPRIDSTTIIDWSSGLKCVMKLVASRENVMKDIRKMIDVSHEHERQWWAGREALIEKQKARVDGQKKLDDVLKAIGAASTETNTKSGPEAEAEELRTYDLKVYKAQHQMVKEMSARLRDYNVPFFGTRSDLVRRNGTNQEHPGTSTGTLTGGKIDEKDLVQLQRRMLEVLEDLCKDD